MTFIELLKNKSTACDLFVEKLKNELEFIDAENRTLKNTIIISCNEAFSQGFDAGVSVMEANHKDLDKESK